MPYCNSNNVQTLPQSFGLNDGGRLNRPGTTEGFLTGTLSLSSAFRSRHRKYAAPILGAGFCSAAWSRSHIMKFLWALVVGQAEEKLPPSRGASRTPTRRRGPETGVPPSRHASPVPRRRTTTDLPSKERHSRLSTVSRPASSDHSKRKRRESHDPYADTGTSRPYSDIQ